MNRREFWFVACVAATGLAATGMAAGQDEIPREGKPGRRTHCAFRQIPAAFILFDRPWPEALKREIVAAPLRRRPRVAKCRRWEEGWRGAGRAPGVSFVARPKNWSHARRWLATALHRGKSLPP